LIRIFKSNNPLVILFLLLYTAVLRLVALVHAPLNGIDFWSNPLARVVYGMTHAVPTWSSVWDYVMSVLVTASLGLYLTFVLNRVKLNYAGGFFPAFVLVLAASFVNEFCAFSAPLCALLPLIAAFATMSGSYKMERASGPWFDAGFLISTAALLYFPYIAFVLFLIAGFLTVRPVNMREFLISLLGIVAPLFFTFVYYYWDNRLPLLLEHYADYYAPEALLRARGYLLPVALRLGGLLFLLMIASVMVRETFNKAVMQHRVIIGLGFIFIGAGAVSTLLMPQGFFTHFIWICVPFAMMATWVMPGLKRAWTAEVLHLCLILLLLFFQYFYPTSVTVK